jgi:hypothetical protein
MKTSSARTGDSYVLRYRSLCNEDRILFFPCDAMGLVRMDYLSDRQLNNYLFARAMVGVEFDAPQVLRSEAR